MTSATRLISTLCEFEPDCVVVVAAVVVVTKDIVLVLFQMIICLELNKPFF